MNCLATYASSVQFVDTVAIGDTLVLYSRHNPLKHASNWCESRPPLPDNHVFLHGISPIFVKVEFVRVVHYSGRIISTIHLVQTTRIPEIPESLILYISHNIAAAKQVAVDIVWDDAISRYPDQISKTIVDIDITQVGLMRRDAFCETVLAAHLRHTERAMMREIFAKKIGDTRAIDMIVREFFPLM